MNKTKVLIVEDIAIVALDLKNRLTKLKFIITDTVSDGNNVLNSIKENEPDIILMDINLRQDKDGIDIVRDIHAIKYIPIIYLTGFSDDEIINKAVQTNPVGYLIKPYNEQELKANIILGLYKSEKNKTNSINHDHKYLGSNYYFDTVNQKLYFHNNIVKLGLKETKLLNLLIDANSDTVSFETIESAVWGNHSVSSDSIRNMVRRLRNKLDYKFIKSIPCVGFRL